MVDRNRYPSRGLARLGVVVPVSNTNLEPDMMMLAPPGVSVHFARVGGYDVEAIPDEHQMRNYAAAGADDAVDGLRICGSDIILYGCTSATLARGPAFDEAFRREIEARTGITTVTAAGAVVNALTDLGARRFAFTSPYVETLNDLAVAFIETCGFQCVGRADSPRPLGNAEVADIAPARVREMAEAADDDGADVIVISCTDFRAVEAVPDIERHLGKPVVTSNQALMYAAARRLAIPVDESPLSRHLLLKRVSRPAA